MSTCYYELAEPLTNLTVHSWKMRPQDGPASARHVVSVWIADELAGTLSVTGEQSLTDLLERFRGRDVGRTVGREGGRVEYTQRVGVAEPRTMTLMDEYGELADYGDLTTRYPVAP